MRSASVAILAACGLSLSACASLEEMAGADFAGGTLAAIGLADPNRNPVPDPQPRGPLVVPGSRDLPAPRETAAGVNDPAWPRDPEAQARASRAEAERLNRELVDRVEGRDSRGILLSREELASGTVAERNARRGINTNEQNPVLTAEEMRRQDQNVANLAREASQANTERRFLTDPPSDYRSLSQENYEGKEEILSGGTQREGIARLWPF